MPQSRLIPLILALTPLIGCVPVAYNTTPVGRFEGIINLRWVAPNTFFYFLDASKTLRFTRANGQVIEPGPMMTDGGSIRRGVRPRYPRLHGWRA